MQVKESHFKIKHSRILNIYLVSHIINVNMIRHSAELLFCRRNEQTDFWRSVPTSAVHQMFICTGWL